ncbi:hypothetical protein [Arsenicibacter rosenii]|uniref:Uncharacterized protein n=1 Tax=Arsenicibacter rosenii TaxID=1750698 RepID=A0A1S2VAH0_9BACT|nr:hypothetical protein [Arsenicibacter rosenii]OIN55727.1 hypothetical protein BLX24_28340 [Arsenicibacter rosenii]
MCRNNSFGVPTDTAGVNYALNTVARYAISYKDGFVHRFHYAGGVNVGYQIHTSAIGATWPRLSVGCFPEIPANGGYNGHISKVAYWPKQLTDAQIQTLVQ